MDREEFLKEFSRKGGRARAKALTSKQRKAISAKGGKASAGVPRKRKKRGKHKKKKKAE